MESTAMDDIFQHVLEICVDAWSDSEPAKMFAGVGKIAQLNNNLAYCVRLHKHRPIMKSLRDDGPNRPGVMPNGRLHGYLVYSSQAPSGSLIIAARDYIHGRLFVEVTYDGSQADEFVWFTIYPNGYSGSPESKAYQRDNVISVAIVPWSSICGQIVLAAVQEKHATHSLLLDALCRSNSKGADVFLGDPYNLQNDPKAVITVHTDGPRTSISTKYAYYARYRVRHKVGIAWLVRHREEKALVEECRPCIFSSSQPAGQN